MPVLLLAVIIIIDQWTKYYIQTHMTPGMSFPVLHNIFHISYVLNPGAAFGILENRTEVFVLVAGITLCAAYYFYRRIPGENRLMKWGIGLLSGGAIGNLIDRIRLGSVVDFFDLRIWPVFNVADIAIVCGVCLMIVTILRLSCNEDETI